MASKAFDFLVPGYGDRVEENGVPKKFPKGRVLFTQHVSLVDLEEDRFERMRMRRPAVVESKATVYGRKHTLNPGLREHSPSGISKKFINADGTFAMNMIHEEIKKAVTNDQARMTRMNKIVNNFVTADSYENYCAMLFSMLSLAWTILMTKKTTKVKRTLNLNKVAIPEEMPTLGEYKNLFSRACEGVVGLPKLFNPNSVMGFEQFANLMDKPQEHVLWETEVWMCPGYDDGHVKISRSRFEKAGFVNQMFLAGDHWQRPVDPTLFVGSSDAFYDGPGTDNIFNNKYFVRSETMTPRDFAAIYLATFERHRATPFLCDQDVKNPSGSIVYVGLTSAEAVEMSQDVMNVMPHLTYESVIETWHKFVAIHRVYDDATVALRLFNNFIVQHDPDTVEAHAWFDMEWYTMMPQLGMRRAALAMFLDEGAAFISPESVDMIAAMKRYNIVQMSASHVVNSTWFWGEYLWLTTNTSTVRACQDLIAGKMHAADYQTWQATVRSGVTAIAQPVAYFKQTGTMMRYCNDTNFGVDHLFVDEISGELRQLHLNADFVQVGDRHRLDWLRTIPPSGQEVILGFTGDLMQNCPYRAQFGYTKPEREESLRAWTYRMEYNDLWALNAVSRWQGYDVRYSDGGSNIDEECIVSYAANDVSLPPPPEFRTTARFLHKFDILRVYERDHVFGSNPWECVGQRKERRFQWKVGKLTMTEDATRRGNPAMMTILAPTATGRVYEKIQLESQYIAQVLSKYNPDEADFRLALIMVGDTIPTEVTHVVDTSHEASELSMAPRPDVNMPSGG